MAPRRAVAGPLAYREWGDPDAPALLVWPGLQIPAPALLDESGSLLAAATGTRALAISPPGWETQALSPERYRPTALADLVVELLDGLELERATYMGFSWGASIGCHLAAAAPERLDALVLLDAGYTDFQDQPGFEPLDFDGVLARALDDAEKARWSSWDECVAFFRPRTHAWRPALEARLRAGMREDGGEIVPAVGPEPFAAAAYGVMAEPPSSTLDTLGRLDLPILLVVASDTIATEHGARALERFRRAVPHAEVEEVDSSHDVLADAPEETIAATARFLREGR